MEIICKNGTPTTRNPLNVYEQAQIRLEKIFGHFDNIYVSFSGGKDSGVLLQLCTDYIRKHCPGRKIGVFHLDYEIQYGETIRYVDEVLASNSDIFEVYRVCVPFKVSTCTSMFQKFWRPWDEEKKDCWVRSIPEGAYTRKDFPFFSRRMWDYDFQRNFARWLHRYKKAKRTCCLVGIRTQESLNRWRVLNGRDAYRFKGLKWVRRLDTGVYNAYPIYDWLTRDIWIANGKFTLYGEEHQLAINNGPNSLHGGPTGFHARVWDAVQPNESTVIFNYTSADGEEGFPGTLEIEMTYRLEDEANALVIEYRATTDKATVVNLTNHGFFNLAGISNPSPTVLNNILTINADFYVPIDEVSIPTGEILKVENTPMDFRTPHAIGERIDDKFQQLVNGAGYDHCYVLNKAESGELSLAATCTEPVSGRTMEVYTTENGLQLYTGNWLGGFTGAHGATFPARSAVCFEAQCFPDTPNKAHFPSAVLLPGDEYQQITIYKFGVQE